MKKNLSLVLLLIQAVCLSALAQRPRVAAVTGVVVDRQGRPTPGLAVFLVSQGRSAPRTTDRYGKFLFTDVPAGQQYFVEVYWGRDLMYRKPIVVQADTNLGVLRL